jgi:cation-transporting ATPase V
VQGAAAPKPRDIPVTEQIEVSVEGMTCASCAARVEKTLGRQKGVDAARVNLAASRATFLYRPDAVSVQQLEDAIRSIGYKLTPLEPETVEAEGVHERDQRVWWRRVLWSWPLGLLVLVLSLFYMEESWARWSALALTIPVQFVAGWPFIKTAADRARTFSANMDTLIAIGTLAAFFYSTYEVLAGGDLYFDTAALIIAFIVLGRYFEARAKGRASSAIRKTARVGCQGSARRRRRRGADGARGAHRSGRCRARPSWREDPRGRCRRLRLFGRR